MIIDNIVRLHKQQPNSKLAIFIRHGEKLPANCGPALLTDQATKDISAMAYVLKDLGFSIQIYSSPELRCVETAKIFNKIICCSKNIVLSRFLGDPGAQVKQLYGYLDLYMERGARVIYDEWVKGLHYDVVKEPNELVNELNFFLDQLNHDDELVLLISQSGTIAALEYALNLRRYEVDKDRWVGYLDGFVIPYT